MLIEHHQELREARSEPTSGYPHGDPLVCCGGERADATAYSTIRYYDPPLAFSLPFAGTIQRYSLRGPRPLSTVRASWGVHSPML